MPEVKSPKSTARGTKVAFRDVVRLCTERSSDPEADGFERFIGLEHLDPGELRVRRWGDLADGVTFTNVFRPGQVLFGKRCAYQRKVAVAEFSGVCSGDIYVFEPKGDALLPELLPFICQTEAFFEHAVGTSAGSLSPRTNWESLANFEFTLPSKQEQGRILLILGGARRLHESLRLAANSLAPVLEVQFAELIQGNVETLPPSIRGKLDVSKWRKQTVGDLCAVGGGHGFTPKDWADAGMPIIRIQNVRGSREFNYYAGEPDPAWIVEPGELLFAWAGVPGVSFGPGIWPGPRALLNQHIYRVTPKQWIERDWLYEALLYLTPHIERRAHGFKTSLLHIRKEEFTSQQVLVPPTEQQVIISQWLAAQRRIQSTLMNKYQAATTLYTSILSRVWEVA